MIVWLRILKHVDMGDAVQTKEKLSIESNKAAFLNSIKVDYSTTLLAQNC